MEKSHMHNILVKRCPKGRKLTPWHPFSRLRSNHALPRMVNRYSGAGSVGDIPDIADAAVLHDIGKTVMPPRLVNKEDKLTDSEIEEMQEHTVLGGSVR